MVDAMSQYIYIYPWKQLKSYTRVSIFGAGCVGVDYYYQAKRNGAVEIVDWVDSNIKIRCNNTNVKNPDSCDFGNCDVWVIAVKQQNAAEEIRDFLIKKGVKESCIFWDNPEAKSLITLMEKDCFLSKLQKWKIEEVVNSGGRLFQAELDIKILKESYRRIYNTGKYDQQEWLANKEKKVAYLNNAKVACSSIIASLAGINHMMDYQKLHRDIEPKLLCQKEELDGYYKFTFVRNPFSRLVSCYKNKYHTDKEVLGSDSRELYFGKSRYLMGYFQEDCGFQEFVKKVCDVPVEWQDRHFRSQYDLLYGNGQLKVDFWGKFENILESFEAIRSRFKLPNLNHYNNSRNSHWEDFYDAESAKLVFEKYRQDFKVFGYEEEYDKLRAYIANKESVK